MKLNHIQRLISGLQIFQKAGETSAVPAHDMIYCGVAETLTPEQKEELTELGWFEEDGTWAMFL